MTNINENNINNINKNKKHIVVFDMDETLGHFVQLGIFWDALKEYNHKSLTKEHFNFTLDLFQKFLRPKILKILKYLKEKKIQNNCDKIIIYTNNQAPKEWSNYIQSYFNHKIKYPLFDQVIGAYKVQGKIIEENRTSHNKSVKDLLKCTNLPENTQICFLDDVYHPYMKEDNVVYINIKPYIYNLPFENMANIYYDAYYNSKKISNKPEKQKFINYIKKFTDNYKFTIIKKSLEEENIDDILSKKIFQHLKNFFE